MAQKPDILLVTGDIADSGKVSEYEVFRQIIEQLAIPYLLLPGNHDKRDAMRQVFADHGYLPQHGPLNWVVDNYPLRLIGLDSLVDDKPYGMVSGETLNWLDARLAETDRQTLIAIHHPPFSSGMKSMDAISCLNGDEMAEIVSKYQHVIITTSGHQHRSVQTIWAGTMANICPATSPQIPLILGVETTPQIIKEPPSFQIHYKRDNQPLVTHTIPVGDFGGLVDV